MKLTEEQKKSTRILIIDDEAPIREVLSDALKDEGFEVVTANDGDTGLKRIAEFLPHLVFLDIWMPGSMDGMEVLALAKQKYADIDFIMISGHGNIETAVKATKIGAWDFIEKPLASEKIYLTVANAIIYRQEREEKSLLLNKLRHSIALVGESPGMVLAKQVISRVAPTESWVLIQGEPGSGKQLIAQNIHYMSSRAGRPFTEMNCAQIPDDLLEGELFGFEKGSMPGMDKVRKGKLELAHGGTLFLGDIGAANLNCQAKLFRYLQERKFMRVGGSEWLSSDVRIIASTSWPLEEAIKEGRFREDFYYRLNVVPLHIPALRERPEDVAALTGYFSDAVARDGGYGIKVFSERALEAMSKYSWSGNVRELKNFVERIYILTPSEFVDLHDLRFAGLVDAAQGGKIDLDISTFREARARFEKEYLLKKITENGGNISKTAEVIGLERSYLHRKIKSYAIEVE